MESYINNNVSDITYVSELIPLLSCLHLSGDGRYRCESKKGG